MHSHTRASCPLLTFPHDIIDRVAILSSNPKLVLVCKTLRNGFPGLTIARLIQPQQRVGEMMAKWGRADLLAACLVSDHIVQGKGLQQLTRLLSENK